MSPLADQHARTGAAPQLGVGEGAAAQTDLTSAAPTVRTAVWITLGPFTFRRVPFTIQRLPEEYWAYRLSRPPATLGWGVVDRYGVRMDERGGGLYDHPVGQAQYTAVVVHTIDAAGAMRRYLIPYRVGAVVSVNRRPQLNGVQHLRLASGSHAGQWVVTPALTLTG